MLKDGPGKDLLVLGNGDLAQTLMEQGLVHEYQPWIHPIVLGSGKRLFRDGSPTTSLRLVDSKTSSSGGLLLTYQPALAQSEATLSTGQRAASGEWSGPTVPYAASLSSPSLNSGSQPYDRAGGVRVFTASPQSPETALVVSPGRWSSR
jgi:hypothetical protein